jgi:hypothetical protein
MFRFAGVVLNSSGAMQEPSDGFPPVTLFPTRNRRSPVPPVGASSFSLWPAFWAAFRRFASPARAGARGGLLQVSRGAGVQKKVKPGLWAGLPPFRPTIFPLVRANLVRERLAARAWRLSGKSKAGGKTRQPLPKSHSPRSSSEAIAHQKTRSRCEAVAHQKTRSSSAKRGSASKNPALSSWGWCWCR